MSDGKTKGGDLETRMYDMNPRELADEFVSLLYDDGRMSTYAGGPVGCDPASCRYASALQLEVLAACHALRRLCDEVEPAWRVAVLEALVAAPRAIDALLAVFVSCPYIGPADGDDPADPDPHHPARAWDALGRETAHATSRATANAAETIDASPEQRTADFARCMLFGPLGLLNELCSANHPVLAHLAASPWWPRAAKGLVRMTAFGLDEFVDDDAAADDALPLGDVAGLTLALLLMVAPRDADVAEPLRLALEADEVATDDLHASLLDWRDADTLESGDGDGDEPGKPDGFVTAAADLLNLLATGARPDLQRLCLACCAPAARACTRCKAVYFCGPACQKRVWPEHRRSCGGGPADAPPDAASDASSDAAPAALPTPDPTPATKGIDYSRWDHIGDSDDEAPPPRVVQPHPAGSIEYCSPASWTPRDGAAAAPASDTTHPSSW